MNFEKVLVILTGILGVVWIINKFIKWDGKYNNIKETLDYIASFFIIFLVVLIFRTFCIEGYRIPSSSMKPTLLEGDFILVKKYQYGLRWPITHNKIFAKSKTNIKRGDVIIFWQDKSKKILIKRVVGLPGDHIVYSDQKLYINDQLVATEDLGFRSDDDTVFYHANENLDNAQHEIYVHPNDFRAYPFSDLVVGKDSYFVLGDNRSNSADSRIEGVVADQDILGKAFYIYLSVNWAEKVFRFDRMFKTIK
jgi:signal peptidase I